jgi:hypothetical protein
MADDASAWLRVVQAATNEAAKKPSNIEQGVLFLLM